MPTLVELDRDYLLIRHQLQGVEGPLPCTQMLPQSIEVSDPIYPSGLD